MDEISRHPRAAALRQLLLGLINGAFYAMLSLGLAVIFGLLNIINFTHGAQFMMGAFVAWMLLSLGSAEAARIGLALMLLPLVLLLLDCALDAAAGSRSQLRIGVGVLVAAAWVGSVVMEGGGPSPRRWARCSRRACPTGGRCCSAPLDRRRDRRAASSG